jgi:Zn-dependent protease with chaperone function
MKSFESFLQMFSSPAWNHLVLALLHSLWIGAVIAGGLVLALKACENNPEKRYSLALGALGALVLSVLFSWAIIERSGGPAPTPAAETSHFQVSPAIKAPRAFSTHVEPVASTPMAPGNKPFWMAGAAFVWLAGQAFMFLRLAFQLLDSGKTRAQSIPILDERILSALREIEAILGLKRVVQAATHPEILVPGVIGVFSPLILLPVSFATGMSAEQLRAILAHELAHVRRHDFLINVLQQFAEAVLFFNPAVWWINRVIRLEREACCDAAAASVTKDEAVYANALSFFAEQLNGGKLKPALQTAFPGDRPSSTLLERMRRLVVPGYQPLVRLPWYSFLAVLAISVLLLIGGWQGSKFGVVFAAKILTPKERIAKIGELKATQGPEERDYTDADKIQISGHVRTWDSAQLPEGVQVHIESDSPRSSYGFGSIPLKNGWFETDVQYGIIYLLVGISEGSNYGPALVGPLTTKPGGMLTNIDVVLPKGFSATLRTVDPSGQPLKGVQLEGQYEFPPGSFQIKGITDSNGEAVFSNLVQHPMNWAASLPGYQLSEKKRVELHEGKVFAWQLDPARITSGQVVSRETGKPIAGAALRLISRSGAFFGGSGHSPVAALTDEQGRFELKSEPEGAREQFTVSAPGFGTALLEIMGGQSGVRVQLGPDIFIQGEIHGDLSQLTNSSESAVYASNPLQTGGVQHEEHQPAPVHLTNGIAYFRTGTLIAGETMLGVGTKLFRYQLSAPLTNLVIELAPQPASVQTGEKLRQVIVRFRVPAGAPPVQGRLQINITSANSFSTNEFVQITNNEARFEANVPGWIDYSARGLTGDWIPEARSIQVSADSSPLILPVKALPAGAILANVRNEDGLDASGVLISVSEVKSAPKKEGRLGRLGKDSARPGDGPTRFLVQPLPLGGTYVVIAHRDNQFAAGPPIKLNEGNPIQECTLQFVHGLDLIGQIRDEEGKAVPRVQVLISYDGPFGGFGWASPEGGTDKDGRFTFHGINPNMPGYYSLRVEDVPGFQTTRLQAKFGITNELVLARGKRINGTVIDDATGNPIMGADIFVMPAKPREGVFFTNADKKSDAEGHFTFSTLPEGEYKLRWRNGEIVNGSHSGIPIRAGEATNVIVRIKPAPGAGLWELGKEIVSE